MQRPVVNTEEGSNPGAPLAWGSPENPDDAVAGYGYVPADTSEVEETFYYHSDHLGSTSYITDQQANVTRYDAYLSYGEFLVDEHSSSADLPYKFNGRELDEETGLYYYGARYMNPLTSMWYGVDPLAEKYVKSGSYVYCLGNPVNLIDLYGQEPDDYEAALMAGYVYKDPKNSHTYLKKLKERHWVLSNFKTSIRKEYTGFKENGLQTVLFERELADGKKEYAYVYAGTNSFEDAIEDVAQVFGLAPQYSVAIHNARTLSKELGKSELTFVGHSLGGGETIAASKATGRKGIAFNPATVSWLTEYFNDLDETPNIKTIVSSGDKVLGILKIGGCPLSNIQYNLGFTNSAQRKYVNTGKIPSHSIDDIIKAYEKKWKRSIGIKY